MVVSYDYAADIRRWERLHGRRIYLNPPRTPNWMVCKK
jgi:hypothetical protein